MGTPEWEKFITLKLVDKKVAGEKPHAYWGDLKKNHDAHNRDYRGVYTG
jgi:hypothetical protein